MLPVVWAVMVPVATGVLPVAMVAVVLPVLLRQVPVLAVAPAAVDLEVLAPAPVVVAPVVAAAAAAAAAAVAANNHCPRATRAST
jgi:hypothetical protein